MSIKKKLLRDVLLCAVFAGAFLVNQNEASAAEAEEISVAGTTYSYGAAYDRGSYYEVQLNYESLQSDFTGTFNAATRLSKTMATASKPFRIVIPGAHYSLDGRLHVYSNTTIVATGATIAADDDTFGMVIVGRPESDTLNGYSSYQNIAFEGGTWDIDEEQRHSGSKASYFLKAGYVTNLSITNLEVKNAYHGHMMEIGGCKNVQIRGCSFSGYTGSDSYEAIQFDVMHSSANISGFNKYTDEPVVDAVIEGCTFTNLIRGIGSHHTVIGKPYNNIVVQNNVFKTIEYDAVYAVSWQNSRIVNNQISDAYNGIYLDKEMKHVYFPNSGTATLTNNETLNTVISGNVISTRRTPDASDACAGISVRGNIVYVPTAAGVGAGVYYYSGVTVTGNTINGGARWGIGFRYVKDCTITNNFINGKKKDTVDPRGITAKNSLDCSVSGNTIKNYSGKGAIGIAVDTNCTSVNLSSNKIYTLSGKGSYGIVVRGNSTYSTISGNLIKNVKKYGIYIKDTTKVTASSNSVYNVTQSSSVGIAVLGKATNTTLNANKVKNVQGCGIDINKAINTKVLKNKIFSIKTKNAAGIKIEGNANNTTLTSNVIKDSKKDGICIKKATILSIKKNTIDRCGKYGIYGIKGSSCIIQANTIRNASKYGIYLKKKVKTSVVQSNRITSCGHDNEIRLK